MNAGPTPLVLKQLQTDGYELVGGGVAPGQGDRVTVVTFFKNSNNEWIATQGNDRTTRVVARGTDMQIREWAYSVSVSFEPGVQNAQSAPRSECAPFDRIRETVLKDQFAQANLIEGRLANGDRMQTYINEGTWMTMTVKQDAESTTCPNQGGVGFRVVAPLTPVALR